MRKVFIIAFILLLILQNSNHIKGKTKPKYEVKHFFPDGSTMKYTGDRVYLEESRVKVRMSGKTLYLYGTIEVIEYDD